MTPLVVSNASPLIALHAVGQLDLLRSLFVTVNVPPTVAREVAPSLPVPPAWIVERLLEGEIDERLRRAGLDPGERDVIGLALQRPTAWLVLDDRPARRMAERVGLSVVGTIGVVVRAKQRGLLPAVRPTLDALIRNGLFVGQGLYREVLVGAGESL